MEHYSQYFAGQDGDAQDMMAVSLSNGSDFWYEPFAGVSNDSGVRVNGYTALGNCHVWKALNVLAGDMGQLPVKLFKKQGGKSVEVEDVPEITCLRSEPNPWMLPSVYKETSMWTSVLWGNSVSWIRRPTARSIQLIPLAADRVEIIIDDELTGSFFYRYRTTAGARIDLDREEVIHVPGLAACGLWGFSLLDIAKNAIGHGLALEKFSNKSFSNGAQPSGVIKHPGKPNAESRAVLRQEWDSIHRGPDNAGKVAILIDGMDYMNTGMTMESAQVESLRRLDREFVSEITNLPLYKLNSMENSATRANLEQQQQEYLIGSLMPRLNKFREEWERKILSPDQRRQGYYYRWITEALLRSDTAARFAAYGVAIQNRIMNPNEAREKEDMEPYEGGEEFGNPNIDPKAANDADNKGGRPPGSSSADSVLERRLHDVITAESNAVRRAVSVAANFVNWIDTYYGADGGFSSLLKKTLEPLAAFITEVVPDYPFDAAAWAAAHAAESKRLLLKLCDQTTKERLAESVKAECETWNTRATR